MASVIIDTSDVEKGIKKVIKAIYSGTENGVKELQNQTHDYVKKRLDLFRHTSKKESYHGLVKPPTKMVGDGVTAFVEQKSEAGKILEYKLNTSSSKPWFISIGNPKQKKAHGWLRRYSKNGFVAIRADSQISKAGKMRNVKPMQDAFEKVTLEKAPEIISKEIIKEIKRKLT